MSCNVKYNLTTHSEIAHLPQKTLSDNKNWLMQGKMKACMVRYIQQVMQYKQDHISKMEVKNINAVVLQQ